MKYVIITLLITVTAAFIGGYFMFATVFARKQPKPDESYEFDTPHDMSRPTGRRLAEYRKGLIPQFRKLKLEELEITSFDGLKLKGYLLKGDPKEVIICVHGYHSCPEDDFCDKLPIYRKRGSTVLFVVDRGHGDSEGQYVGFSELDRFDVQKWVEKVNELYDDPKIYLHGVSMGGATVIHCADMKLRNVCGIIDDCGFNSILSICKAMIGDVYNLPFFPCGHLSWLWARIILHMDYDTSIGERCVANTDIPILFIHGREDHYVPLWMAVSMYVACKSPKELLIVDGCGHAAACMCAPEEYEAAVNRLLDGRITGK